MAKHQPIIINGQEVGKLKASWLLLKETWRYFKADPEMLLIPIVGTILNYLLLAIILGIAVLAFMGGDFTFSGEGETSTPFELTLYFFIYVAGSLSVAFSQAAIVHTVYTRAHNGNATLGDSLKMAFSRWVPLFVWSLITSTVGLIIRAIAERSKLLGRILLALLGTAWSVMTYFVVPAMIIDRKSAFESIGKSKDVFKTTWGETLVSNISLSLIFLVFHIIAFVALIGSFFILAAYLPNSDIIFWVVVGVFLLWILISSLLHSALDGVLRTLLYIYASERVFPPGFNQELLYGVLGQPKTQSVTADSTSGSFAPSNAEGQAETKI